MIGHERAADAPALGPAGDAGLVERAIDEQLTPAGEEVKQAHRPLRALESVAVLDRHPRHTARAACTSAEVRLEARANLGIAAGLQAKLKHDFSLYRIDVVKDRDTLRRADQLVRGAEASVGLHASSPVYFVYGAREIWPAG